jgi:hypothetical protein
MAATNSQLTTESNSCYDRRSVRQSVLLSSPFWGPRPDFSYWRTVASFLMWGALSDERTRLTTNRLVSPLYSLGVGPHGTHRHHQLLYCCVFILYLCSQVWWRRIVFTVPLPSNGWRTLLSCSVMWQQFAYPWSSCRERREGNAERNTRD